MGYTLKSTGLAADLIACYMVDDDGVTLREWVSGQFSTWNGVDTWADDAGNADMSVDNPVVVGQATWKGTSFNYFQTLANGTYNFYGIRHSAAQTVPGGTSQGGFGVFAACAGMDAGGAYNGLIANGGSNAFFGKNDTDYITWYVGSGYRMSSSTQTLPSDLSTKFSFAGNWINGGTSDVLFGLESGSLANVGSAAGGSFSFSDYQYIGGLSGSGNLPGKHHLIAIFNRPLSDTEYQSLHNDWFGALFQTPGAHSIAGNVNLSVTPSGTLSKSSHHSISAAVSATINVSATLQYNVINTFSGAVSLTLGAGATMVKASHYYMQTDVIMQMSVNATMQASQAGQHSISGGSLISLGVNGSVNYATHQSLLGSALMSLTPAASMQYGVAGQYSIAGDVGINLTVSAVTASSVQTVVAYEILTAPMTNITGV